MKIIRCQKLKCRQFNSR